jgi:hypothetical protein
MYKKIEIKIKTSDFLDKNNEYHLWISTFSLALQDLITSNNFLVNKLDHNNDKIYIFFFFKLAVGFLKETLDVLESCLGTEYGNILRRIKGFKDEYDELDDMLKNNPRYMYLNDVIKQSRNKIFHYNDFGKRKGDAKEVRKTLEDLYKANHISMVTLYCDDQLDNDYKFAEELQLNQFERIIKTNSNYSEFNESIVKDFAEVIAKVINLLQSIISDYILNIPDRKKLVIKYK